jgi:hypothetical protein
MRTLATIAGLAFVAVAALPPAAQAGCQARDTGTLFGAVASLLDHVLPGRADRTPEETTPGPVDGAPSKPSSRCPPSRAGVVDRSRAETRILHAEAPRYAAANCGLQSQPTYDAAGMVTYQPTRVCGRF